MNAFHLHVQLGCVAQGLPQHLALNRTTKVWRQFRSWLRTINPSLPPSELAAACALHSKAVQSHLISGVCADVRKVAQSTAPKANNKRDHV
jgi:hypothetical protein